MKDYYLVLGIPEDASEDLIKKAFRALAHQYHPDKIGGDGAKFKEINEAYQVLSNKEKRAEYDFCRQYTIVPHQSYVTVYQAGGWNTTGTGGVYVYWQ